jgi:2-aminoadipate transaminase
MRRRAEVPSVFELERAAPMPLYKQLYRQIRQKILTGALPAGTRLPPERTLANTLGVNRTTVVNAYRDLAAEGLVVGRVGHGTVVQEPPAPSLDMPVRPMSWAVVMEGEDPVIADINAIVRRPDAVSFAHGEPSADIYPTEVLGALFAEAAALQPAPFGYGPVHGYAPLRDAIAGRLSDLGVQASAADVLVLAGTQIALYLVSRVLLQPGDSVVVEMPSYIKTLGMFESAGVRVLPVPVDEQGLQVEGLGELFARYRPKLLYTIPTFQNPTGATMSEPRRRELLRLAARYQVGIVEDDPYGELWFGQQRVPPLMAMDPGGYVIHVSAFSKSVSPSMRIAWVVAPPAVLERLAAAKGSLDFRAALLNQWVLDAFVRRGLYDRHLERVRGVLQRRRDALTAAMAAHLPPGVDWLMPEGGYHLWCRLPRPLRSRRLLAEAAREGVAFIPGDFYGTGEEARRGLRLNFSYPDEGRIAEGIRRLGASIRRLLREEGGVEAARGELSSPVV